MAIQILSYVSNIDSIQESVTIYSPTKVYFKDDVSNHRNSLTYNKIPLIIKHPYESAVLIPDNFIINDANLVFKNLILHFNSKKVFKCVLVSTDACEPFLPNQRIYVACLYDDFDFLRKGILNKIWIKNDKTYANVRISDSFVTII